MSIEKELTSVPFWYTPPTDSIPKYELKWWEPQTIPWQLITELRRRSNSVNVGNNGFANSNDFIRNYQTYKGSMSPWVRVFSNGTGRVNNFRVPRSKFLRKKNQNIMYDGFILEGGAGFENAYGYPKATKDLNSGISILGYQANGKPHYIDPKYKIDGLRYDATTVCESGTFPKFPQNATAPIILPPPGITSVSIKTSKNFISSATINWRCYSLAQLEYMTPFFLSPRINVFLEFGWNLFDKNSLLDYNEIDYIYDLILNPLKAYELYYKSFGNYGLITGLIWKYNYSTNDGFIYDCKTEIISRQALYSMWRIDDNPTVINTTIPGERLENNPDSSYLSLKNFFKSYLGYAKGAVQYKKNFIDFLKNTKSIQNDILQEKLKKLSLEEPGIIDNFLKLFGSDEVENKEKRIQELKDETNKEIQLIANEVSNNIFYNGKPENRIFLGRKYINPPIDYFDITKEQRSFFAASGPGAPPPAIAELSKKYKETPSSIEYGFYKDLEKSYKDAPSYTYGSLNFKNPKLRSVPDKKTDFDEQDDNKDHMWFQLDFIFEIINLFCSDESTKMNKIDISNIKISAHPNLISCDPNVLIPNSIAPKVNVGRKYYKNNKNDTKNGYLDEVENDITKNPFIAQKGFYNFDPIIRNNLDKEKQNINNNTDDETEECYKKENNFQPKPLWKAALKAKTIFKTLGSLRDNLDVIINYLYYKFPSDETATVGSASFPSSKEDTDEKKYTPYYYGYLKHIYISKKAIEEIANDESVKNLETLVNRILDAVNNSVDKFWNLELIPDIGNGGLTIVDRNLGLPEGSKIYTFNLGSSNNCIKQIKFDANLSKEQANLIIFQSSNANIGKKVPRVTQIGQTNTEIIYQDRFDEKIYKETIKKLLDEPNISTNTSFGGIPHGPIKDVNPTIARLQKYGPQTDTLIVRLQAGYDEETIGEDFSTSGEQQTFNWVYLNLPPSLKPQLRQILDDDDTKFNLAKYSGAADNFILTITFDGIFGLNMFQHFAINNLPKPYVPGNVIFMVTEIDHQISNGKWETVVQALLRSANGLEPYEYINV